MRGQPRASTESALWEMMTDLLRKYESDNLTAFDTVFSKTAKKSKLLTQKVGVCKNYHQKFQLSSFFLIL